MSESVLRQVAELQGLPYPELTNRWRALFGTEPPNYSRPMMVRRLAYRVQELAHGGLSDWAKEELARQIEGERLDEDGPAAARKARKQRTKNLPVAGTRLVREWAGTRHEVTILRGGRFEYHGQPFRSLTAIARQVTGSHRNGPAFFGLRDSTRGKAS